MSVITMAPEQRHIVSEYFEIGNGGACCGGEEEEVTHTHA